MLLILHCNELRNITYELCFFLNYFNNSFVQSAFRDNTVGLPKICPPESIMEIPIPKLMSYLHHHHGPERLVVAGVGVDHDHLVQLVER